MDTKNTQNHKVFIIINLKNINIEYSRIVNNPADNITVIMPMDTPDYLLSSINKSRISKGFSEVVFSKDDTDYNLELDLLYQDYPKDLISSLIRSSWPTEDQLSIIEKDTLFLTDSNLYAVCDIPKYKSYNLYYMNNTHLEWLDDLPNFDKSILNFIEIKSADDFNVNINLQPSKSVKWELSVQEGKIFNYNTGKWDTISKPDNNIKCEDLDSECSTEDVPFKEFTDEIDFIERLNKYLDAGLADESI